MSIELNPWKCTRSSFNYSEADKVLLLEFIEWGKGEPFVVWLDEHKNLCARRLQEDEFNKIDHGTEFPAGV